MNIQKKKFFNVRPTVFITVGLIFGILIGYFTIFKPKSFAILSFVLYTLAIFSVALYFAIKRKTLGFALILCTVVSTVLGMIIINVDVKNPHTKSGESDFKGCVTQIFKEEAQNDGYYYSLLVKGDFLDVDNGIVYSSIFSKNRVYEGNSVSFSGYFTLANEKEDFAFSTDADYTVTVNEGTFRVGDLNGLIPTIKRKLFDTLESFTPSTYFLTYALMTGETAYVPSLKLERYQNVSVSHLFAVSGLHIGLMYGVLVMLFKLLRFKNKIRLPILSFILFCYVGFCGFSASSMRAFIIIAVREVALTLGLKSDKTTNLSISAFIVLLINPSDLFSAGFLLSFSVYAGLILLVNPLAEFLSRALPQKVSQVLSPCLVAEVVSFPILIDFFGKCSAFGFLFNLVIIPFVSFLYPFIFLSSVLLTVFQAEAFAIIPNLSFGFVDYFLSLANTELFMLKNFQFSYSAIFYYLSLYSFAGKLNLNRKSMIVLRIIIISAFILTFSAILY